MDRQTATISRRGFDLATFERMTAPIDVADIDVQAFVDQPLDAGTLRCLRYMHDIESHTVCYLRDLLLTSAHRDPEVTAFMTHWNTEEYWHGVAIGRVLEAHGEVAGPARVAVTRHRTKAALRPLGFWLASLVGDQVVAVSMAWGAINEMLTQAGYSRLLAKADHPELRRLLKQVMRQEGRHIDFYVWQARTRLARDRMTQRLTRTALARWWEPVGAGVVPASETAFLARHLFQDEEGRAAADRIDRRMQRLPGLEGLALVRTAARRWSTLAAA